MIELPRITSSIGSSGTESREVGKAEVMLGSAEAVEEAVLDIEDDFGASSFLRSSAYDFARALNSASSFEDSISFFSRFHHINSRCKR